MQHAARDEFEAVRRVVDAVNDRDVERYLAGCTEDVELFNPLSALEGAYVGESGIRRFFDGLELAPDFRLDIERLESVAPGCVIASVHLSASGRATGLPVGGALTNVYELAGGRVRRVRVFGDREEALAFARRPA